MAPPSTSQRLVQLEREIARNSALIAEIHTAVVGDGSKGSSLRERTASLEAGNDWRHKALYSVFPSVVTALLAQLGFHLPHSGGAA